MPVDPAALAQSVHALLTGVIATTAAAPIPPTVQLDTVLGAALTVLGVDRLGVLLLDEHGAPRTVVSTDPSAAALEHAQQDLLVGPSMDVIRDRTAVVVHDLLAVEQYRPLAVRMGGLGVRALVSAPVWVNGGVAGTFDAMCSAPSQWAEDEIAAVNTYADVVAILLQLDAGARPAPGPDGGTAS